MACLAIKHGVPYGFVLGPTLVVLYINDLPAVINKKAIPVFFADDRSILFTTVTYGNPCEY